MMSKLYGLLDEFSYHTGDEAKALEAEIWQTYGCDCAVLVLDMSGFSRLTRRFGIVHYLSMVRRMQKTAGPLVTLHNGEIVKFEADNLFATFKDCADAIRCARSIHEAFRRSNQATVDDRDVRVSIGVAWGRILVVPNHDYFGDAVNVACKLGEDLADPEEILIDDAARQRLPANMPGMAFEPLDLTVSGLNVHAWTVKDAKQ